MLYTAAGEVICILATILVILPNVQFLLQKAKRPTFVPDISYKLWSAGFVLFWVYMSAGHPVAPHARHRHVITDMLNFPVSFQYVLLVAAVISWLAMLKNTALQNKPQRNIASIVVFDVMAPIVFIILVYLAGSYSSKLYRLPSRYQRMMGFVSIAGSVIQSAGTIAIIVSKKPFDFDLVVMQTLGYFAWLVNITLMYANVDWAAVTCCAVLVFSNLILLISKLFTKKAPGYEELAADDIELDHLPSSRSTSCAASS